MKELIQLIYLICMDINIPGSYFALPPGTQIMDMSQMMSGAIPQE